MDKYGIYSETHKGKGVRTYTVYVYMLIQNGFCSGKWNACADKKDE